MLYSTLAARQNIGIMKRHLVTMAIENCVKLLSFHYCHFSYISFFSKWNENDMTLVNRTLLRPKHLVLPFIFRPDVVLRDINAMFQWTVFTVLLLIFQNYMKCLHTKRTHFLNGRETLSSGSSKSAAETPSSQILGDWLFSRWIFSFLFTHLHITYFRV